MKYFFPLLLGLLPSLIWLAHYLKKDKHPEPNSLILEIFVWGIMLAPLAIVSELFLTWLVNPNSVAGWWPYLSQILSNSFLQASLTAAAVPALVEECLKFSIVKQKFLEYSEFDEPADVMVYCITGALGFAAVENLIILFRIPFPDFNQSFSTIGLRFLGATSVHALACGLAGYWLARGILFNRHKKKFIAIGMTLAILFHACYNYLILNLARQTTDEGQFLTIMTIVALLFSGMMVIGWCFEKLKKERSICLNS